MIYDRHHLLQIILWPNEDGTFRTILNSKERLKELGIYDEFKLTITIPRSQHIAMHNKYEPRKPLTEEHKAKLREKSIAAKLRNPLFGSKGMHWYNNGTISKFAYECPPGFVKGRMSYKKKKSS